jgi:hypothetical protein
MLTGRRFSRDLGVAAYMAIEPLMSAAERDRFINSQMPWVVCKSVC